MAEAGYRCRLVEDADVVAKLKRRAEYNDEGHEHEVDVEPLTSSFTCEPSKQAAALSCYRLINVSADNRRLS